MRKIKYFILVSGFEDFLMDKENFEIRTFSIKVFSKIKKNMGKAIKKREMIIYT